ncbi:hypothetical protein PROFUN_00915 [Planoprotostelium fungivorum]|uniref:3'(2'),5'-bisphosphate nucleotidase 1 n=1 Tax=Planoprotostelium fungivorum TaxID=1890364 RepID=A0A2P6P0B0_9EUKA|nr:hypothetical protein PROFUN_14032 [Planoprotostelium fungivorum]PRP89651.1 hypothetical protein PROFUN_00915 [Planoprotostelium fungivorum]
MSNNSDKVNLGSILSVAIDASQKAGTVIRQVWKSGKLGVEWKGVNDPMTEADVQAQKLIFGLLYKAFGKDLPMVGEEDTDVPETEEIPNLNLLDQLKIPEEYKNVDKKEVCVFVDPLDATREFVDGNLPAVMTLIGISYRGEAIAGVMFQPFVGNDDDSNGTTIYGMLGMGTNVPVKARDEKDFVIATTRSHATEFLEKATQAVKADRVVKVGGAGYKCLLVLRGEIDAYFFPIPGTKKWDTCGPEAIIKSAGGSFTDAHGRSIRYTIDTPKPNTDGLIVTLKGHDDILAKISSVLPKL